PLHDRRLGRPLTPRLLPYTPLLRSKAAAGNVSTIAAASLLLDQTAPSNGSATALAGSGQVALSWTGFTDAGSGLATTNPYKLFSSTNDSPASCSGTPLVARSAPGLTHPSLTHHPPYFYRHCVRDNAATAYPGLT